MAMSSANKCRAEPSFNIAAIPIKSEYFSLILLAYLEYCMLSRRKAEKPMNTLLEELLLS